MIFDFRIEKFRAVRLYALQSDCCSERAAARAAIKIQNSKFKISH